MEAAFLEAIEARREEISRAVVECVCRRIPPVPDPNGMPVLVQRRWDVYALLRHLEQAVCAGSVDLLTGHIAWVRATHAAYEIPPEELDVELSCLEDVLHEQLERPLFDLARPYLLAAFTCLPLLPLDLPSYIDADFPLAHVTMRFLQALLDGDEQEADRLIDEAFESGVSVEDVYLKIFQRSQYEVGRLWQMKKISVEQEHFCTAVTQRVMARRFAHLTTSGPSTDLHFIAACVDGELHTLGLRMVVDLVGMAGWNTYYLGAEVPVERVVHALGRHRAQVLGISVTMPYHVMEARAMIQGVRASEVAPDLKIIVGGYALNEMPDLWRQTGADGYAENASEAVRVANRLVGKT